MLERSVLTRQVVDQVDAEVEVLEPGQLRGALGLRVAGAIGIDRVWQMRSPASRSSWASGEKISFQAWWRSTGGRCAPRMKRLAL